MLVPSHLGFFVYAAARGDFVLGGLQAVFETELDRLLDEFVGGEHRCAMDPGCTKIAAHALPACTSASRAAAFPVPRPANAYRRSRLPQHGTPLMAVSGAATPDHDAAREESEAGDVLGQLGLHLHIRRQVQEMRRRSSPATTSRRARMAECSTLGVPKAKEMFTSDELLAKGLKQPWWENDRERLQVDRLHRCGVPATPNYLRLTTDEQLTPS